MSSPIQNKSNSPFILAPTEEEIHAIGCFLASAIGDDDDTSGLTRGEIMNKIKEFNETTLEYMHLVIKHKIKTDSEDTELESKFNEIKSKPLEEQMQQIQELFEKAQKK